MDKNPIAMPLLIASFLLAAVATCWNLVIRYRGWHHFAPLSWSRMASMLRIAVVLMLLSLLAACDNAPDHIYAAQVDDAACRRLLRVSSTAHDSLVVFSSLRCAWFGDVRKLVIRGPDPVKIDTIRVNP